MLTRAEVMKSRGFSANEIARLTGQPLHRVKAQLAGFGGDTTDRGYKPPAQFASIEGISSEAADLLRSSQPQNAREEAWLDEEVREAAQRLKALHMQERGCVEATR